MKADIGSRANEDIRKLVESTHCFFCSKLWKNVLDFYAHLPYDLIHDEKKRKEYGRESAICPFHLWQLSSMASKSGLSLILAEMARETSHRLRAPKSHDPKPGDRSGVMSEPGHHCLVCRYTDQAERQSLDYFKKMFSEPEALESYLKSKGFCLRHAILIADSLDGPSSELVITHAIRCFSELSENLLSFSHKTGIRRRDLIQPDEEHSVSRALIQLGGVKYLHYLLMG